MNNNAAVIMVQTLTKNLDGFIWQEFERAKGHVGSKSTSKDATPKQEGIPKRGES